MVNLTYLLVVVGFIYTAGAEEGCEERRDVDIVFELPEHGRVEALTHAKAFFGAIAKRAEHSCWRPRIHVAGSEVYEINSLDCFSLECITSGSLKIEADKDLTEINAKEKVKEIIQILKREAFESDIVPGLDGPRRLVLLVLTSRPEGESFIPAQIVELLEGGYTFAAVGVKEGKFEPLQRIASKSYGFVELDEFSQLSIEDEVGGNIFSILDDPEKPDEVTEVGRDFARADYQGGEICKFIADIAFLIDSSGSVKKNTDYVRLKEFVIQIANKFNISKTGARAGAVVFSDRGKYTKVHVRLNQSESNSAFREAILASPYMGFRTRIDLGLQKARADIFNPKNGARKGVSKIVFLLTDGQQNPVRTYNPVAEAKKLLDEGVKIFAIGITNNVDAEQLEAITGESERVYYSENFHSLTESSFMKTISDASCRAGSIAPPVEVIPTTTPTPTTTTTTTPPPGECDFQDDEQCKIYKDAKESYCVREWLKVNCKYMCGICEYEDKSCLVEDNVSCSLYENGKETYCQQAWVQNHCKFMCGICADESATTMAPTTETPEVTTGVGKCSTCCHGHSVYLNIFRKDSGPNYVMQGMKLQPSGKFLSGVVPSKGPAIQVTQEGKKISLSKFFKVLNEYLPGKPELVQSIQQMVSAEQQEMLKENTLRRTTIVAGAGVPSMVMRTQTLKRRGGERKRRSLDADTLNTDMRSSIIEIVGNSGCKLFLQALKDRRLVGYIDALIKETKRSVVIFCPIDSAFKKIYRTKNPVASEKEILLNHIAFKHDSHGTMFETLSGGKIILNPVENEGKTTWSANGVDIILSLTDGSNREVVITKDVIYPKTKTVMQVLESNKNLSIFTQLFKQSDMAKLFNADGMEKICFSKELCVRLSAKMQEHMTKAIDFKQYTILAPTNNMFKSMTTNKLKSLFYDSNTRLNFLQEHIFLGSIDVPKSDETEEKKIAYSVSPFHSVLMMNQEMGDRYLVHSDKRLLQVTQSIPVIEGTIFVADMLE